MTGKHARLYSVGDNLPGTITPVDGAYCRPMLNVGIWFEDSIRTKVSAPFAGRTSSHCVVFNPKGINARTRNGAESGLPVEQGTCAPYGR